MFEMLMRLINRLPWRAKQRQAAQDARYEGDDTYGRF